MLDLFNNDDGKKRFCKSLSGKISIPLGYWTFNTSMSYSKDKEGLIINKAKAHEEQQKKSILQHERQKAKVMWY
ncbi:hypothetical protein AGMMS49921_04760 [Endomicrobiia bacterium]|nr:hypothetical protein AGMMS49921_04760 [Endomicrobiia bacterium]